VRSFWRIRPPSSDPGGNDFRVFLVDTVKE
jgi:hypothetical protein